MAAQHAFKVFDTQTGEYLPVTFATLDHDGILTATTKDDLGNYFTTHNPHLIPHFPADIHRRNMELREGEEVVDMLNRVFPVGSKVWWKEYRAKIKEDEWSELVITSPFFVHGEIKFNDAWGFDEDDINYNREHPIIE